MYSNIPQLFLKLGTAFYYPGYLVHKSLYSTGLLKRHRASTKVVCVGNLTVGGTGKTPFTETLCRGLVEAGMPPVILSRGYKRSVSTQTPVVVSDGKSLLFDTQVAGDEPTMLAMNLPGIPVIVHPDRYRAALAAMRYFSPQVLVLDDGFQHWALERDVNVVLWDATVLPEKASLLPAGPLREPLSAFRRADIVVLTKTNIVPDVERARDSILRIAGNIPLFTTVVEASSVESFATDRPAAPINLARRKVMLVSAIASPEIFEHTVVKESASVTKHLSFPDHHIFSQSDVDEIRKIFVHSDAEMILTTQKDYVKLRCILHTYEDWYYLKIRAAFCNPEDESQFMNVLSESLKKNRKTG